MKANKLQELVSNQVANAIETATSAAKAEKSSTSKKAAKAKDVTPTKEAKLKKKTSKKEEVTKEVTKQQNTAILEEVVSNREVKYIYPADVKDTLARKRWRQQTRNELHALERDMYRIKDQNSKEFKEAKRKYEKRKSEVLKTGTDC